VRAPLHSTGFENRNNTWTYTSSGMAGTAAAYANDSTADASPLYVLAWSPECKGIPNCLQLTNKQVAVRRTWCLCTTIRQACVYVQPEFSGTVSALLLIRAVLPKNGDSFLTTPIYSGASKQLDLLALRTELREHHVDIRPRPRHALESLLPRVRAGCCDRADAPHQRPNGGTHGYPPVANRCAVPDAGSHGGKARHLTRQLTEYLLCMHLTSHIPTAYRSS
jgi:hypothetical protein